MEIAQPIPQNNNNNNNSTTGSAPSPATSPSPIPRKRGVPLGSIVRVLVNDWSHTYLDEANNGNIESMCLIAHMYTLKDGYGEIKYDPQQSQMWLKKAKKIAFQQGLTINEPLTTQSLGEWQGENLYHDGTGGSGSSDTPVRLSVTSAGSDSSDQSSTPYTQTKRVSLTNLNNNSNSSNNSGTGLPVSPNAPSITNHIPRHHHHLVHKTHSNNNIVGSIPAVQQYNNHQQNIPPPIPTVLSKASLFGRFQRTASSDDLFDNYLMNNNGHSGYPSSSPIQSPTSINTSLVHCHISPSPIVSDDTNTHHTPNNRSMVAV